jgi:hypothetical protein
MRKRSWLLEALNGLEAAETLTRAPTNQARAVGG